MRVWVRLRGRGRVRVSVRVRVRLACRAQGGVVCVAAQGIKRALCVCFGAG